MPRQNKLLLSYRMSQWHSAVFMVLVCGSTSALSQNSSPPATSQLPAKPIAPQIEVALPYVDRVMDASAVQDNSATLDGRVFDPTGWPRSMRIDYSIFSQTGTGRAITQALGLSGFFETPNYGALSVNANLTFEKVDATSGFSDSSFTNSAASSTSSIKSQGSTWRIDQRGLPLDGGWFANHSAGDISTVSTPMARGLGRVTLPNASIRGLSGQWLRSSEVELNASAGRAGYFSGYDITGFQPSRGSLSTAGTQFRLPAPFSQGRLNAAVQVIEGKGIADGATFTTPAGSLFNSASNRSQDTRALWGALAWEGSAPWADGPAPASNMPVNDRVGGLRVQGNFARSRATLDGDAVGIWLDAAWRTERWRNMAGLFRFEPNLRWGAQVVASNLLGMYLQADTSTRQWQAGYAVEVSEPLENTPNTANSAAVPGRSIFTNINGRYRLDSTSSVGASLNVRSLFSPGQALLLSLDRTGSWGQTQLRSDFANTLDTRTTRLGIDQSWSVALPATFNTSLAWERTRGGTAPGTAWIWGLLGSVSPFAQWSIDAALRGASRSDKASSLSANVGVSWQSFEGWSLGVRYTEARGREPLAPLVVSALAAATTPAQLSLPTNRSLQLLLRYEARAGSSAVPLGGVSGVGSGSIGGSVFYDGDANGRREASEGGVAGVTVILDRRYVTKTDAQGRYEFAMVAPGDHVIEISSDNVPLPWSPALREPAPVRLSVRQLTTQDFAVQRER